MNVRVFLDWEIEFNKLTDTSFSKVKSGIDFLKFCIEQKYPITVNQIRKDCGFPPHPDDRGNMKVYEEDPGSKPEDSVIPSGLCYITFEGMVQAEAQKEIGRKTREELELLYPELAQRAKDEAP